MNRLLILLFLLPSLGSCTIEDDFSGDYLEPPARVRVVTPNYHTYHHYHEPTRHEHPYAAPNTSEPPARVRVETPNYHTHRHYHESSHHEHPYAVPNAKVHVHVSENHERMHEPNNGAVVRVHRYD